MKKNIYIFSGLGADERIFRSMDFTSYNPVFIRWVRPLPGETMEGYAKRLLSRITSPDPVLLGISFGGMMASELAKQVRTSRVIYIATAKIASEIPFYFRILRYLPVYRLVPAIVYKSANIFTYWLFGAATKAERVLLRSILRDTDTAFLKWAIDRIIGWKNTAVPRSYVHIHGTADRILPEKWVHPTHSIPGGTHLLPFQHADLLEGIINKLDKRTF